MSDQRDRIEFARGLRRNMTEAERALWRMIGRLRPRFTRQYPIGPYVADFACRLARLVVEVDCGQHAGSEQDRRRAAALAACGWRVLRYWNNEVLTNGDGVVLDIIARGEERLPEGERFGFVESRAPRMRRKEEGPPPAPPRRRGGAE